MVKKRSLAEWVSHISEEEMPIFGHTVQSVLSVAEDEDAPAAHLAQVVLQDASMTARVLKLANSTYYNPREQGISTISRAVVVLGFNTVRNMCLSISLVDAFVRGGARDRLTRELARAIHAAVQARAIATTRGDESPEEVFIATLLYHIGEMAFWCFSGELGDELEALMRQPGYTPEQAQQELLGFRLQQLSSSLAREWRLSPLLQESLRRGTPKDPRSRGIGLAHELSRTAVENGWHSPPTQEVIQQISKATGASVKVTTEALHRNAREAAHIASYYGAASAAAAIPLPSRYAEEVIEALPAEALPEFPEPDGMLQLKILRELATMLEKTEDFNVIMELVLEGIYRGIGMDRVLFALITPDRKGLRAKYGLGHKLEEMTQRFHFTRLPQQPNLFFEVITDGRSHWFDEKRTPELKPLVGSSLTGVLGRIPFFAAPIEVHGNRIGLIYADRGPSQRPLDQEAFDGFMHFAKQANMGLTLIATRR